MPSVLVVEDDQDLAEMLGIVLNGAGIEVDLVSRGDEALEVFKNNQPDVVLLDVMLPGADGVEVCRAIREQSPRVPIIFLSARGDNPDKIKGLEAGADDYLVKP
ncbi:MAG: response regulator, partial [Candidatus Nanopelagicaceae bacterium]